MRGANSKRAAERSPWRSSDICVKSDELGRGQSRKPHWRQCLDEAGEGKLWKAAIYMRPRDSWGCACPQSRRSIGDRQPREGKAQAFVDSFFPVMALAQEESLVQPLAGGSMPTNLSGQSLSLSEIRKRLNRARRRGSSDAGLGMFVEAPWKPHYSDLRGVD